MSDATNTHTMERRWGIARRALSTSLLFLLAAVCSSPELRAEHNAPHTNTRPSP